jgi:hypothetical protein
VLVASEAYARANGLPILARIKAVAISGCQPEIMGIGPVESSRKALARAGITAADLDVVELNEAFASQSLACIADLGLDVAKVNIDGGAIAIGHPLGATGRALWARRPACCNAPAGAMRWPPVHWRRAGYRHGSGARVMQKVCVIGAGTMGAGIAAQVANAGVPVLLLDIVRDERIATPWRARWNG